MYKQYIFPVYNLNICAVDRVSVPVVERRLSVNHQGNQGNHQANGGEEDLEQVLTTYLLIMDRLLD